MAYVYLVIAFILNSTANILLKVSSEKGFDLSRPLESVSRNLQLPIGLALFAANVVFYYLALRSVPLSVAYPIMVGMSVLIINSYAVFAMGERATAAQVVGYTLLVAGVVLVFSFGKR